MMRGTHPSLFQGASAKGRKTVLHCESKGNISQPYVQSTLDIDVSLHKGIPPGRPPDLSLMRDILSLDSPLLYFGEVKSWEENFGMRDVKVADNSLRRSTLVKTLFPYTTLFRSESKDKMSLTNDRSGGFPGGMPLCSETSMSRVD